MSTTKTKTMQSTLDYNVINKSGKINKKQRLLLIGEYTPSITIKHNTIQPFPSTSTVPETTTTPPTASTRLVLIDVLDHASSKPLLDIPVTQIVQMLRNGTSNISLRYSTANTKSTKSTSNSKLKTTELLFISKEDCSEFAVALSLLLPKLKLGNDFFRIDDAGRLVYEVYTLSKKGKRKRTLILNPTEGTLERKAVTTLKDTADIWSENGLHLTLVPEHENRRLMYMYTGSRMCDVEFPSAAIRSDFVSNVRKIVNRLPLNVEFSMGEFKALQSVRKKKK